MYSLMEIPLVIVIGVPFIVLMLIIPRFLRGQNDRDEWRDLQKALKERGRQAILEELDEKINDQLTHIAKLEANAGAIYGAGGADAMHMEHRELRRLYRSRDIATDYLDECQ
jgi:hypothetical protein